MSVLVLRKLLDDWLVDPRFHHIEKINLYNGGETLLHPKRLEMMRILQQYKQIAQSRGIPFPKINLLTNGMLLRSKIIESITREKLVDEIGFSLDGGTPQAFEELRVNAKWQSFYQNVVELLAANEKYSAGIRIYGITIVTDEWPLTTDWMHPEFRELSRAFDHHELRRLHDWGGQLELESKRKPVKHRGCDLILRQMVVLPDGNVTVCCNDLNGKGIIGNIMDNSLWEIYNSESRKRYLKLLDQGRKDELELCKNCVTF